jgi:hypothetical protein
MEAQRGQALVGVLVIMVIVFAFAGGLTLAVSSVLGQQNSVRTFVGDDLASQNGVNAGLAWVAGRSWAGSGAIGPLCSSSTVLNGLGAAGELNSVFCKRIDGVNLSGVSSRVINRQPVTLPAASCVGPMRLPGAASQTSAYWFNARWNAGTGRVVAYLDSAVDRRCNASLSGVCTSSSGSTEAVISQVASVCDFGDFPTTDAYLYLLNPTSHAESATISVRYAAYVFAGGSVYLIAAPGSGSSWEEGDLFISPDGSINVFRWEARL